MKKSDELVGVVIVTNGNLAVELLSCLEHIVGRQDGIVAVSIEPDHDRKRKQEEICHALDDVDCGKGVVVVTDIYGSSPANLSLNACQSRDFTVLSGVNVPMLIKLVQSRALGLSKASDLACAAARKHIGKFEGNGWENGDRPETRNNK